MFHQLNFQVNGDNLKAKNIVLKYGTLVVKGFCQAPTRIIFFFGNVVFFCVFSVVFMFQNVSQKIKNWKRGWWVGSDQSEFFSDFWIFFNLTRPLN